jgi:hypothetical protein
MSATLHRIYQSKSLVLTKTMVIKLQLVAQAINADLISRGYMVDENRPETWKYYLNLNGEYHQADHDKLLELSNGEFDHIRIKVAGDNQPVEVDFNKTIMQGINSDLAIANEYRFNTQYYNGLVSRYPEFEDLIKGVLNPIPPAVACPAYDGEILYCGGYLKTLLPQGIHHMIRQDYGPISENFLIETNEENLIHVLQEHINAFIGRYTNVNYQTTHNLFYATLLSLLYMSIPGTLSAIRLENAHDFRGFTHSFHIREFLDSLGQLGWVVEHLKKKEQLWLYRNLRWLDANRGKDMTFQAIIENILTPSNIPISGHRLRHDISEMDDGELVSANPFMLREALNPTQRGAGVDYRTIAEIVKKEIPLATENYYDQEGQVTRIANSSRYSMYDNVNTKVLESSVIDDANNIAVTMEDIGLSLWAFTASHGFFKGSVIVTHPITSDRLQLTPLNAYILSLYCLNMGWAQYDLETIPDIHAMWIPRVDGWKPDPSLLDKATLADMKYGTNAKKITEAEILDIMGNYIPTFTHTSALSLGNEIQRQHAEAMRRYMTYAAIEDMDGRAMGEWVSYHQYWNWVPCKLSEKKTYYKDWLILHGLDLDGFSRQDYVTLGLALVEAATGMDLLASQKLRDKQNAVLSILKHFCSYTVQIIQDVAAVDSFMLGLSTLRLTNLKAKLKSSMNVMLPIVTAVDASWKVRDGVIWLNTMHPLGDVMVKEYVKMKDTIDTSISVQTGKESMTHHVKLPLWTIIDAIIPDIVIDERVKVFGDSTVVYPEHVEGDATTQIYPVSTDESINLNTQLGSKLIFLPPPKIVEDESSTIGVTAIKLIEAGANITDETIFSNVGITTFTIK